MDRFARTEIDMLGQLPDGTIVRNPQELRAALLADPVPFVRSPMLMNFAVCGTGDSDMYCFQA